MADRRFWIAKSLDQLNQTEWESLCDGCGKCCLHKLEDEDSGEIAYTRIACVLLDVDSCRCRDYLGRFSQVPECLRLKPEDVSEFHWLPRTCAYRLIAEGEALPDWHPLISADPDSVHRAGVSVSGFAVSESEVAEEDWFDHLIEGEL